MLNISPWRTLVESTASPTSRIQKNTNTVGAWILNMFGFGIVKSSLDFEWFCVQMPFEIQTTDHSKIDQIGSHLEFLCTGSVFQRLV